MGECDYGDGRPALAIIMDSWDYNTITGKWTWRQCRHMHLCGPHVGMWAEFKRLVDEGKPPPSSLRVTVDDIEDPSQIFAIDIWPKREAGGDE